MTIASITVPDVAASQPRASVAQQTVIIDGARTPEQLPEYVVWTHGFTALDTFKRKFEERLGDLTLSPTEANLVFAAAATEGGMGQHESGEGDRADGENASGAP
jgi:hypothetical protein